MKTSAPHPFARGAPLALAAFLMLAAFVAALVDLAPVRAEDGEITGIDWLHDLDAARAKARKTGRPILAVFR